MRLAVSLLVLLAAAVGLSMTRSGPTAPGFSRTTIDVGVVVSDLEASAAFYTDAIGFEEVEGFSVPADFCSAAGLTDAQPLTIRVFVLGKGESATRIKLMEVPDAESKRGDNAFIHSQLGFSYLTVFVEDTKTALARLKGAGSAALAKGPVRIGEDPEGPYLTLVRDPDGNLIELVGP